MARLRVYVAGPLSSSGDREENVARAIEVTRTLVRENFAPLCPHLTHFADPNDELGWEAWLETDEPWVAVAHAVFRISGKSTGADRETTLATGLGIPIFYEISELIEWRDIGAFRSPALTAHGLVHGNRGAAYGHPLDDFSRTGRMWGAILERWRGLPDDPDVPAELVALMMAAVKISREVNGHNDDSAIDLAGYAETLALVVHERTRRLVSCPD